MRLSAAAIRILKRLDTKTKISAADMADKIGSRPGPTGRALWSLAAKGLVKATGNGRDGYEFRRMAAGTKILEQQ
jgi:predicted ArsR family transcriptional regulator